MGIVARVSGVLSYLLRSVVPFFLNYLFVVFVHHFAKIGCDKFLSYFHGMNLVSENMGYVMGLIFSLWITWFATACVWMLYHSACVGRQLDGSEVAARLACAPIFMWPLLFVYWEKASNLVSLSSVLTWVLEVV